MPLLRTTLIRLAVAAGTLTMTTDAIAQPTTRPTTVTQAVSFKATPLPPSQVRLTGGPLKHAQDLDAAYLLKLEPDRMLAFLRERAGLPPKAKGYGGWDGAGRQLTGHIAGHYLSGVSYMYEATGDIRFKERADYIVAQLKEIQDKQGDGYIGGLMGEGPPPSTQPAGGRRERPLVEGKALFEQLAHGEIRSGGFDLNGMWSPWYVQHKIFAGLRDAYRHTGNATALEVETKFAGWVESILGHLSDEQIQKMLATEFGGMNEVLIDLYADTGDARWLKLADKFDHKAIVDSLSHQQDVLPGKHGNTQVPKLLGTLDRYIYTGDPRDGAAATFFWDAVVQHHSFVTGGHGYDEYFGPADKLSGQIDGTGQRSRSLRTAETCNVYNMLKYTRRLFALQPDVRYAAFQERALYNHILASIDPEDGRTCYMVPVGPGVIHEYQDMFDSFTCCVGTGMESHALHADGLYFESGDQLWINVYAPTAVNWKSAGLKFTMASDLPLGDRATLTVDQAAPARLTLRFRRPAWAGEGFSININGQPVASMGQPDSYVEVTREWSAGDVVTVTLPKTLHTEPVIDNPSRVALLWGPLVLAGDLGSQRSDDQGENARADRMRFPVFAAGDQALTFWLHPVDGKPGTFQATLASGESITLSPFYALHRRRYSLYWDLLTPAQWADRQATYAAQENAAQALAKATVSYFQPGEMQTERDFSFQADTGSQPTRDDGQPGRRGGTWWSIEAPIDPDEPVAVIVYARLPIDARPSFSLSFNDTPVEGEPSTHMDGTSGLTDVVFKLPKDLTREVKRARLKLHSTDGKPLPTMVGVRVVRAESVRR
ncbi:MAG: glycoside hydrolase family 127 protein [Tepidisphaeraceae bacterium]